MSKKQEKLMIIDGNAIIHRSFHALPPTLRTKDGELVNAVYGFAAFLIKAWKELKPDYIVLTLDKKAPTFRHEKYAEYKATRVKAPDDLYKQIPLVKDVAKAFNLPIFEMAGFEADDLIGTIATVSNKSIEKIIVTGDMDTLQLVNDNTKVFAMGRGLSESVIYDAAKVRERFNIDPSQMIDYKALRGDPSDNIPGVKGIGEKTASGLLNEFKTLDGLYENFQTSDFSISDRIKNLLTEHKDDAYLSQDLATIKLDVPLEFDLEKCRASDFDVNKVAEIFSELEFKTLLPRVQELFSRGATGEEKNAAAEDKFARNQENFKYILVDDDKKFKKFLAELKKQKFFAIDTETTGFDPITSSLRGISFSWQSGTAFFVSFPRRRESSSSQSSETKKQNSLFSEIATPSARNDNEDWIEELKPILANEKIKKCGHNIKFDWRVLKNAGFDLNGIEFDSMIASYLLNPGSRTHGLDSATFSELGFEKISKNDLLGSGKEKTTFAKVDLKKLSIYSCEDADFTYRLSQKLAGELKEKKSIDVFNTIEMPLVPVLGKIEENGVLLDKKFLGDLEKKLAKDINSLEKKIYATAGEEFNVNSTKQLKEILFEKLQISTLNVGKTKTGFSTAADELDKLKDEHEIIPLIQNYRELAKLQSTYISALPELINEKTGRVHASFNQTITATGRLSSSDPNLQNIPARTELGQKIRQAFIAPDGWKIVSLDYSQIELRLAAHLSGDERLIETFNKNLDIHTATAALINDVPLEEVTKDMRREAKATNFGVLYGQGAYGLSQTAGIPFARAKEFIANYFAVYKDVEKYTKDMVEFAKENGYVETLFGRRRYLPEISSQVPMVRAGAERMAVNTPLQGTNADMIKKAMVLVQDLIEKEFSDSVKMIIQVHDELVFEMREDKIKEASKKIQEIMSNILKLKVPVVVDVEVGENWGDLKKL
ncbi:MAG: DNA polymerase I [Patescibacteria group bacterium]|jgi:DNA polymerase-1